MLTKFLIIAVFVFGASQLVSASVLQNFRADHNHTNDVYEELKDERTNGNLRSFQSTPFLYFNGSARTEGDYCLETKLKRFETDLKLL